jgi:hypothetical protein
MFQVQNVPIVIEPGVEAIEADFIVAERPSRKRGFPVQLFRVTLDSETVQALPFIPSAKQPHVFSLAHNPDESLVLIVYDSLGRINLVYTRDETGRAWEKNEVADEHAGKTVKQFSIRYFFNSEKSRNAFMHLVDGIISHVHKNESPPAEDVVAAIKLLARARVSPVALPVAVAKTSRREVAL